MDDLKQFIYSQPNPRTGKNYAPGEQIPKSEYAALTAKFGGASAPAADMSSFTGSKPNPLTNLPEAPAYEPQTLSLTEQEMQPTLVSENPVVRFAESQPEPRAQAQQAPAAQAAPQDDFYNWTTNTYKEDLQRYKGDLAALTEELNQGRIKTPQFLSRKKLLESEFSPVIASAIPNFDSQQQALFKQLTDAGVASEDAVFQVGSMRRANTGGSVDPKVLDETMNQSSYRLTQLLGGGLDENAPEVKLERENLKRLGQQRLGIKETPEGLFMDVETKRQMIPVYAANGRPFEGRDDYDNISAELTDAQLAAGMEGLRSGSKMFVNMNSYAKTKDGRITSSAFEQYKTDVTEAKKLFGQAVVFDGNRFNVTGKGEGEVPATPEEVATTPVPVEGPASAKVVAKTLRDIGKATGMEDPPHIYAKKMYERYVGKPFTDAAWPWVRTFLQEVKQPAVQ